MAMKLDLRQAAMLREALEIAKEASYTNQVNLTLSKVGSSADREQRRNEWREKEKIVEELLDYVHKSRNDENRGFEW